MKKEKMRKLNGWAKDKPLGLVMIAQQFAVGAEPCFRFLKLIKSGDKIEAFSSLPKAKEWVRLYRNHRQMQRSVIECLRRFGEKRQVGGWGSGLGAALKAAYLAGESPVPGIAYLPG